MAYNSKFTGAQIDALLDASEAMKTSKEDTANKVTSLDNPSDVTFPTTKAVVYKLFYGRQVTRGYYFDALKGGGALTAYSKSKLTPFLYIPQKTCIFKKIWGAENVGAAFVYFDKEFNYIGESVYVMKWTYTYDPSVEAIPDNAKYMIAQFQDDDFDIITDEFLNTGIDYFSAIKAKNNTQSIAENLTLIQNNTQSIAENSALIQKNTEDISQKIEGTIQLSKNLFDKTKIIEGYFVGTGDGKLWPDSRCAVSPLIPITAGEIYYLGRPCLSSGCPVTHEVRFVAEDKTTPIKPLKADGSEFTNYLAGRNTAVKAPIGAAYFQFTVKFKDVTYDYDAVQFELGDSPTSYVPYEESLVVGFDNLPTDLKGLPERVQALEANVPTEKITIANSDKIGFFSNSFLNGYCMLGKHAINNLSMFSDYIMYNYGHSGDDLLELLKRVNDNETWLGDVPVQNWGITYGVIAMQDNDGALFDAASDTYYENGKKLANAIKAMGGIPILSTEHDSNNYYYNFVRLAKDYGIEFINWGLTATRLFKSVFAPFWYNSHPATRTAWMWTYGIKPYLDSLPRPHKAIKLFRVRPNIDVSAIQNLMFEDNVSRASIFEEIACGVSGLTEDTEKYFDRIDNGNTSYKTYKDEYQTIQSKTGKVSFGEFSLIEVILPYDKNGCTSLLGKISGTGITNIYIRKINSLANPLSSLRYVAFGIVSGTLSQGQQFEITGGVFNDNLLGSYTVADVVNGIVVTTTTSSGKTTSGTDNPITNIEGLILKGSYVYPSAEYMKRYNKPLGEWVEIPAAEEIDLSGYIAECLNFDKVSLLLKGNSIELSDLEFSVSGVSKKVINGFNTNVTPKRGISILSATTFSDENTEWIGLASMGKYNPVKSTVSEQYEQLPTGIISVRYLTKGQKICQRILTENINDLGFSAATLQIRVIARYFPEYIDTDDKWASSKIKRGSYDCANLAIRIANSETDANSVKVRVIPVGLWWNEFIIETPYFSGSHLVIEAEDDNIQIAKCEMVQIDNV